MITKTNVLGNADGMTWAASDRHRNLGAPRVAPDFDVAGETSVFRMVAQVPSGIPPRRDPH